VSLFTRGIRERETGLPTSDLEVGSPMDASCILTDAPRLTSLGLSRAWAETAKRERWDRKFGIHLLDEWAEQLVEVENLGLDLQ
jgi:hypothetical protein